MVEAIHACEQLEAFFQKSHGLTQPVTGDTSGPPEWFPSVRPTSYLLPPTSYLLQPLELWHPLWAGGE